MPPKNQENTKKAVTYLKAIYGSKRVNIVAIDLNEHVTGITRIIDDQLINFIERHNGKSNLYYSVNTPTDDAPDGKLKKQHIKEINAVWLDADPDRDKPFKEERERLGRLAHELAQGENPPTVITDSGGGIQAFWHLASPIPATEDNKRHYEALSRGLAMQYGTDKVQNIDRIMRLPYTWNIPTAKKKGREKALARSSKISVTRYKNIDFVAPAYADENKGDIDYSKLDMAQVKQVPADIHQLIEKLRKRNEKIDNLWTNKIDMKPSRSERDFTLAKELKSEGLTLLETAQIMWIFPHGKNKDLTRREIVRCYERSGNDFKDSVDQETIDRIAKQVNPLQKAKEAVIKMLENSACIWGGDATRQNSGVPLFKHFMNRETVNVLFGPSGSGKSFLTLDMAMHLATGRDWAGFKCKEKMAVLYICTESGTSFGKRAEAARSRVGIARGASPAEFPFAYYAAYVDLLNNKDHLKLIAKLVDDVERDSGHKVGLVVVDTLSAAFGGGNENSEDMTKFVNNMSEIKFSKKTAVLIIHHTGKDETAGARGHSSLKGNIDNEIRVKFEKRGRSFELTKNKDGEIGNIKRFSLNIVELGVDEDGDAITTCTVVLEGQLEFESTFSSPEDELNGAEKAAFLTFKKFQESDFFEWCNKKKTPEIRKLMVQYWHLTKKNPEKVLSLKELTDEKPRYKYDNESSNFSRSFDKIRKYLDKTNLTLDQWIKEHLVKPAQSLSG